MQSETADFAPGAATWRTQQNIRVGFDYGLFPSLYENMTSSTKPKVHRITIRGGWTIAISNMYRQFGKI